MNKLGLVGTILPLVIIAIGLIGWVLTLRNDVTASVVQIDGIHEEVSNIHERIDDELKIVMEKLDASQERIIELEEMLALADNEMRTIMADHSGFNDVLKELGQAGLLPSGERRTYGGYGN